MEYKDQPKLSVILPCHNEEKSIENCINDIKKELDNKINYEIVIVDNNSTDYSKDILEVLKKNNSNIQVFFEKNIGYGSACIKGLNSAKGKYLLLMDIDQTYPANKILDFVTELDKDRDFVIGNRFTGNIEKNSMPKLHQFIGNPLLSFILRIFFKTKIRDSHCGMRAIRRSAYEKLNLHTAGMEFASEMIIKVLKENFKISEIPISYHPRVGESKLKSFRDGWRHLRFMLLYSPLYLFLAPGVFMFLIGLISMIAIYFIQINLSGIKLIVHPIFVSSLLMIIGYQLVIFAGFAKTYAMTHFGEKNKSMEKFFSIFSLETAVLIGSMVAIFGFTLYILILQKWIDSNFGELNEIKNAIIGLTMIVLGIQTIASAFMMSIVSIKER